MKGFVINKILSEIEPEDPVGQWILETLFRVPQAVINTLTDYKTKALPAQAYRYYAHLQPVGHEYIDRFNSARADLIASILDPPEEISGEIEFDLEPPGDPSHWLCTQILGFTGYDLSVLCRIPPAAFSKDMGRLLLPVLKIALDTLRGLETHEELLTHYHRTRYRLIKFYMDAYYHELHR
jgi:hypothetical protein